MRHSIIIVKTMFWWAFYLDLVLYPDSSESLSWDYILLDRTRTKEFTRTTQWLNKTCKVNAIEQRLTVRVKPDLYLILMGLSPFYSYWGPSSPHATICRNKCKELCVLDLWLSLDLASSFITPTQISLNWSISITEGMHGKGTLFYTLLFYPYIE